MTATIVVSDWRPKTLAMVSSLYSDLKRNGEEPSLLVIGPTRRQGDYGDPIRWYRALLVRWLTFRYPTSIVESDSVYVRNVRDDLAVESSLTSIQSTTYLGAHEVQIVRESLHRIASSAVLAAGKLESLTGRVYVFNGRLASTRPIVDRLLPSQRLRFYEYSPLPYRYRLESHRPHDRDAVSEGCVDLAKRNQFRCSLKIGKKEIRKHLSNSFAKEQTAMPNQAFSSVLFLGSTHEYKSFASDYPTWVQEDDMIVRSFVKHKEFLHPACIRMHPNAVNDVTYDQTLAKIKSLAVLHDLQIVESDSLVASHELIKAASTVYVWASTVGLDAYYLGAKVVFIGTPWYRQLIHEIDVRYPKSEINPVRAASLIYDYNRHASRPLRPSFFLFFYALQRVSAGIKPLANRLKLV